MSQIFGELTDEQQLKILAIFERTPETLKNDINIIKAWLEKQPHLPEIPSDAIIESFLKISKFSIELTKQKIDAFYTIRNRLPEMFGMSSINPNPLRNNIVMDYCVPLPKLTDDLYRVVIYKLMGRDASSFNFACSFIWGINVSSLRLLEDSTVASIFIVDLDNFTLSHLTKINFAMAKMAADTEKKIFKRSIKSIHVVNYTPTIEHIFKLLKVVSPKMIERVVLHNSLDTLYDYVPKQLLPCDYGGNEECLEHLNDKLKRKISEYKNWFDHLDTLRVNENLRPQKLVNDEVLGSYGNFKKLDVD